MSTLPCSTLRGARARSAQHRIAVVNAECRGRPAEADDIGRVIASLVSDEMGWVNGERIEASVGMKL
jgi:NAD(P)-dependent dehydrogenase (short-subunit alcohol dehydrogenase family)